MADGEEESGQDIPMALFLPVIRQSDHPASCGLNEERDIGTDIEWQGFFF
jgi:hypothetical protein